MHKNWVLRKSLIVMRLIQGRWNRIWYKHQIEPANFFSAKYSFTVYFIGIHNVHHTRNVLPLTEFERYAWNLFYFIFSTFPIFVRIQFKYHSFDSSIWYIRSWSFPREYYSREKAIGDDLIKSKLKSLKPVRNILCAWIVDFIYGNTSLVELAAMVLQLLLFI